ncbi:hypothetical protein [Mangrovibacillus cuniculi]|uniref:DinB family protein n=1 Tax=Mangrovibacillus cuniculi TaxID=2593652 RepID=A0A7S8CDQ2_9BACI|nr:hypothetical protein [Mangrovibacillus cuniculi]QPC47893.1 hypothetical protein G8O30_13445 [Mangrovibacillus cuniculi]
MNIIKQRVIQAMELTNEFYQNLEDVDLRLKIPNVPSNTIGEQAYCIIGARESYLEALKEGQWSKFRCSLTDSTEKELVVNKLTESNANIGLFLEKHIDVEININFLIDLLEHEVQHHGQLIRFAYANKLIFPESWHNRYTV